MVVSVVVILEKGVVIFKSGSRKKDDSFSAHWGSQLVSITSISENIIPNKTNSCRDS